MAAKTALTMVKMDLPAKQEAEWNHWYNTKHLPSRVAVPGFLSGRRFAKVERDDDGALGSINVEPKYLALYDLSSIDVLKGEAYRKQVAEDARMPPDSFEMQTKNAPKFARGVYELLYPDTGEYVPRDSEFVFIVGHDVPSEHRPEFNAWYNTEHLPAMLAVPGFLAARRFQLAEAAVAPRASHGGTLPQFLTIYDIESDQVLQGETYEKARLSPWSTRVRGLFTRTMRGVYRQIYP